MTAENHARALEVLLRTEFTTAAIVNPKQMKARNDSLVALYAAAVELREATEAHVAAATKNEQEWKHTEVHETRNRQYAAHLAFVDAFVNVEKAVNRG